MFPGLINYLPIVCLFPFFLFSFLLFFKKSSLLTTSLITLGSVFLPVTFIWKIDSLPLLVSITKASTIAWDIFIIIIGALFFLAILEKLHVLTNLCYKLEAVYPDYRVRIILLAWFLENFIEGTAGFGTPCAVVAPLLVALGLSPIKAVTVALLGNSTSVVFGAAGTPISIGLAGLNIISVPVFAAAFNLVGFIVPVFILWVIARNIKEFLEGVPFAMVSGLAFVIPSLLVVALGQEFPSILGSIIGLAIMIVLLKKNTFKITPTSLAEGKQPPVVHLSITKTIMPYALLVIFIILGKISFGSFNPGWAFILACVPVYLLFERKSLDINLTAKETVKKAVEPFLVILAMSFFVQLMIFSGKNSSGLPSILTIIATFFETEWLPFLAPFVGAFGAFLTGSATVSNVMFGNLFEAAGKEVNLNTAIILALGTVGAAAGNMIALADMLAAQTVVGLKNQERKIFFGVIVPCLIYLLIVGILGMIIINSKIVT